MAEIEQGQMANKCCPIWDVTYKIGGLWPEISCTTGGKYKCEDCTCTTKYELIYNTNKEVAKTY